MSVPAKQPTAIQLRRGTAAYWTSIDIAPSYFIPRNGEPIYETDTGKMKIGDGVKRYTLLPYSINTDMGIADLGDVTISSPQNDQGIIYESGVWKNKTVIAAASVAKTKPSPAVDGAMWFDSDDGRLYRYYVDADSTGQWVEIKQVGADPSSTFTSAVTIQRSSIPIITMGGDANGSIELGKVNGSTSTPFIDFHSAATASDYNVRLIASGGTSAAGDGDLTINAGQVNLPAKTYAPGSIVQVQHVRTANRVDIATQDLAAITGLSISFTPKFANSKILLTAMINSNNYYVSSFGFLRAGTSLTSTSPNSNTNTSLATAYYGDTVDTNMRPIYIQWLDDATNTNARTYAVGGTSSWSGVINTLIINDRVDNIMRSYSSMTIYEIAQ